MYKRVLSFIFIFILSVSLLVTPNRVYADGEKTASDSKDAGKSTPFGDTGGKPRYTDEGWKYYDVMLPYAETVQTIGGYATSATSTGKYGFNGDTSSSSTVGTRLNKFNSSIGDLKKTATAHGMNNLKTDSNAGSLKYVTDANGVKYYLGAIGQGMYANSAFDQTFGLGDNGIKISTACNGYYFDVILKDGTQIHFISNSAIGWGHSIGTPETEQDGITYHKAKLNYSNYLAMWHCDTPYQVVELSCDNLSKVAPALGISDSNPMVAIRVWNSSLAGNGSPTSVSEKEGITNKGDSINCTNGTADANAADITTKTEKTKGKSSQYAGQGYFSEERLSAWNKLVEPELTDQTSNSKRDNLSSDTMNGLSDWEMNVASTREDAGIIAWVRRIIALMGIFIIIWSMLLYISYWFDLINPFFDFDLMSKITFGKLCASHELDGSCTWRLELNPKDRSKKTINHRGVLFLTFFGLVFGVLVVSGLLYSWLLWVVNWANSVIKDLL